MKRYDEITIEPIEPDASIFICQHPDCKRKSEYKAICRFKVGTLKSVAFYYFCEEHMKWYYRDYKELVEIAINLKKEVANADNQR